MAAATTTTDHDTIRKWCEERDGHPATVGDTVEKGEPGVLTIDFGEEEPNLLGISWEEFFEKFEEQKLAFLHQDKTEDGSTSRFCKLIGRD